MTEMTSLYGKRPNLSPNLITPPSGKRIKIEEIEESPEMITPLSNPLSNPITPIKAKGGGKGRKILLSPVGVETNTSQTISERITYLKEGIPSKLLRRSVVYIMLIKIGNNFFIKIGTSDHLFPYKRKNEQKKGRINTLITGYRHLTQQTVNIAKILALISVNNNDDNDDDDDDYLTEFDVEQDLLEETIDFKVLTKNSKGKIMDQLTELRSYSEIDSIMTKVRLYVEKNKEKLIYHFA
jgi:hypothetical protein